MFPFRFLALFALLMTAAPAWGAPDAASAGGRVALVIGNSAYEHTRILRNPVRDARAIAALLRRMGFDVTERHDLNQTALRGAVRAFGRRARRADVVVLYYAGHGLEVAGENWLVPTDARLARADEVEDEAVGLSWVMRKLRGSARLKLIILDACRNNPLAHRMNMAGLTRAVSRGLARVEPESDGVLVAYAAKHGTVAQDGDGENSPYAAALLKHLPTPGLDVRLLFGRVRDDVLNATGRQQEPFIYGSLGGARTVLLPGPEHEAATTPPSAIPKTSESPECSPACQEWRMLRHSRDMKALSAYIRHFSSVAPDYARKARQRLLGLQQQAAGRELSRRWRLTPQLGHAGRVTSVAFSPDGARIVSGGDSGTARLWDAASGRLLRTFYHEGYNMHSVAFSPDGARILSVCWDGSVRLWDAATGRLAHVLRGVRVFRTKLVFAVSPDGARIASGGEDKTVRLWDVASGRLIRTLRGHDRDVNSVAFSPDGARIVSGGDDDAVRVWDAARGRLLHTLRGHRGHVTSVAFSPDGARIASGGQDAAVRVWDADDGALLFAQKLRDSVWSVAFSPDGGNIIFGDADNTMRVLDADCLCLSGARCDDCLRSAILRGPVAFSPDGSRIVSGGDGTVRSWDELMGPDRLLHTLRGRKGGMNSVAFSPDGARIVGGGGKAVWLWDAATGRGLRTMKGQKQESFVFALAFSPDGARIASGGADNAVRVWDADAGRLLRTLRGHESIVTSVAFSSDASRIASAGMDKTARIWDAATGRLIRTFRGHESEVFSVAFSPDASRIASGGADGTARIWDAATGRLIRTFKGHEGGVLSVAFSPDASRIASGGADRTVRIWNAATGRLLRTFKGYENEVFSVAFSPDGARIVSREAGAGRIITRDAATGRRIRKGGDFPAASREVTADGRYRLAGGKFRPDAPPSGSFDVIERQSGRVARRFIILPEGEWVVIDAGGPYAASPGAHRHLALAAREGFESSPVTEAWKSAFFRPEGLPPLGSVPLPPAPVAGAR